MMLRPAYGSSTERMRRIREEIASMSQTLERFDAED